MGFKQKVPGKVHVSTASREEKKQFKKRARKIVDHLPKDFTAVSLDESFFFFDSFKRRVCIYKDSRPVFTITGSHRNLSMFELLASKESSYSEYLKGLTRIHFMNP